MLDGDYLMNLNNNAIHNNFLTKSRNNLFIKTELDEAGKFLKKVNANSTANLNFNFHNSLIVAKSLPQMSALFPSASTFSLPSAAAHSSFSPQQQLLRQQQQQIAAVSASQQQHHVGSSPALNNASSSSATQQIGAAARNLQTQQWLQNNPNFYASIYNSSQSRAPSAMSSVSGQSIADDASSLSQMTGLTNWQNLSISLNNNANLLSNIASPSSSENVDPNKKNLDAEVEMLSEFILDSDQEVFSKWVANIQSLLLHFNRIKDGSLRPLIRRIIQLLTENQQISDEHCRILFQCFLQLSKTASFEKAQKEFAHDVVAMYCKLLPRRPRHIVHAFPTLHRAFLHSAEATSKAARDDRFVQHILRVLNVEQRRVVLHSALIILKHLIRRHAPVKEPICGELKTLFKLTRFDKSKEVRQCALEALSHLLKWECAGRSSLAARTFIQLDGIKLIAENMLMENFKERSEINLSYTQKALILLRDVSNEPSISVAEDLGTVIEHLLKMLFFQRKQLDSQRGPVSSADTHKLLSIAEHLFGFIRNVLARNAYALAFVSTNEVLFRLIARFLCETVEYLKIRPQRQQQQQQLTQDIMTQQNSTIQSIFEDTLTALTGLNKDVNPQRIAASIMINKSAELHDLLLFLSNPEFYDDFLPYKRFIMCWYRMICCGIIPTDATVPNCLIKFLQMWIYNAQTNNNNNYHGLMESAPQKTFEILAKIAECTQHYEHITKYFKRDAEGYIDLFNLLEFVSDSDCCVAILTLIDAVMSKDYSLLSSWSSSNYVSEIIDCCAGSINGKIRVLGQKIKEKLRAEEDYTMTDAIMSGLGGYNN